MSGVAAGRVVVLGRVYVVCVVVCVFSDVCVVGCVDGLVDGEIQLRLRVFDDVCARVESGGVVGCVGVGVVSV